VPELQMVLMIRVRANCEHHSCLELAAAIASARVNPFAHPNLVHRWHLFRHKVPSATRSRESSGKKHESEAGDITLQ